MLAAAAVLTLASQYADWDPHWVVWQVFDAGTGHGESSGNTAAFNPAGPYRGLMQIGDREAISLGYMPEEMFDPVKNLAAAHTLHQSRGKQPWPSSVRYVPKEQAMPDVTPDGWLTWAQRMPGRPPVAGQGFNAGVNGVRGLVFHSAEGWAETMLSKTSQWGYYSAEYPWHLSNLLDGRLIQHYPFTARCWHGTAFNDEYVGMEHEGVTPARASSGPLLNARQVANARHVIASLSAWRGWTPKRPAGPADKAATLYEHNEVVRFGGTATQCPSHRIPWLAIMAAPPAAEEEIMTRFNSVAPAFQGKTAPFTVQLTDFDPAPPAGTKRLSLEVYINAQVSGAMQVKDSDGKYAGQVGWDGARYGLVEVDVTGGSFSVEGRGAVAQIGIVAIA